MQQTALLKKNSEDKVPGRLLVVLALLFAVVWMGTLGMRKLLNPDEARYAEIPREMIASGDWLTPRLNGLKYFEKPPLQYWSTAVAFEIIGTTEFAARFWVGLTGLAGVFLAGWLGARLFGRNAGVIAAAVLASSLMYFVIGHLNSLDMGLSFFLQLAITGFLCAQHAPHKSRAERNFMWLAWGGAALAVLSKGIVAMVLPAFALVAYTLIEREYSAWRRLHFISGLSLFLALAAPWFVWVSIENPEFAGFFFLHEHFQRFLTDVADRVEPWWYFVPLLIAGCLPWTGMAIAALPNAWRSEAGNAPQNFRPRRFLIVWIAVTLLFFSVSHSKLPPYIVPLFPAIALLVGDFATRLSSVLIRRHLFGVAIFWLAAVCYVALGPLPTRRDTPSELFVEVFHFATGGFLLGLVGAAAAWLLAKKERLRAAMFAASAGSLLATSALLFDFKIMRHLRTGYDLAQSIGPIHDPDKPFYSLQAYDHSLSFYLRRTFTVVDYSGELVFGQQQDPEKSLPDLQSFMSVWRTDPEGSLAVMTHEAHAFLASQGVPMTTIGRDLHLTAVKKP